MPFEGAIGSPYWNTARNQRLVPEGGLREIWSSPAYNHCMFTARPDLDLERERRFADALSAMSYDNPAAHRYISRRRRARALAKASSRWLRCLAASRGQTGILQAAICQVSLRD